MFRRRGTEKTARPVYQNLTKRKGGWMLRQGTFGWMRPGSLKRRRRHASGGFSLAGSNTEGAGFETGPPREIVHGNTTPCKVTPVILHGVVHQERRLLAVILHGVVSPEIRLVAGAEGGCPEARIAVPRKALRGVIQKSILRYVSGNVGDSRQMLTKTATNVHRIPPRKAFCGRRRRRRRPLVVSLQSAARAGHTQDN